jgi:hypothetical protein
MFNKEVYVERRNELKKLMESGVVVLFGNNEAPNNYPNNAYYPFRQDSSFLYYFGQKRDGLVGVIYSEAEWIAQHFTSLPVQVAGKSGTGERAGHNPTAWYVVFTPADDPKYVVCATIEDATWANSSAVYIARNVLGALYNAPDDLPMTSSSIDSMGD